MDVKGLEISGSVQFEDYDKVKANFLATKQEKIVS